MSDDLISREAIIEAVDRHTREDGTLDDDITIILEEVKTAFDKEKVIKQIKVLSTGIILNTNICDDYAEGYVRAAKDIVEIVEKGGIE